MAVSSTEKTPDDELIDSCIQLLKDCYPRGMTIKEMAAELLLDSQPEHIKAICRSSTVLSTKLNSFYRRCHPDFRSSINTKYPTCPLTREVCPDTPNRLMYKYATEQQQQKQLVKRPISPPPADENDDSNGSGEMKRHLKKRVTRPLSPPPGPDSPPESIGSATPSSSGKGHGHYMLRKVIKKTPYAYTPPAKRRNSTNASGGSALPSASSSSSTTTTKKHRTSSMDVSSSSSPHSGSKYSPSRHQHHINNSKRPNPYYESISIAVLDFGYSKPWIQEAKWEDIEHPEAVSLDDLDDLLT